jgi:hypothetical protein
MNGKVEELKILLRDFLYPNNIPEPQKESSAQTALTEAEPAAHQPEAPRKFRPPNTRAEFLEQIIDKWRVAFGDLSAQAEIVNRFSVNIKMVVNVWSLVRLRGFTSSASKLEQIVDDRLVEVLPLWLEANQDISELVSLKNELPDFSQPRELVVVQIKGLIQAETDLEKLFGQAESADYIGDNSDKDCVDFLYEQLKRVLSKAIEAEIALPKLRNYWERCQEVFTDHELEDGESGLTDLVSDRITDIICAQDRSMEQLLVDYRVSSEDGGGEAYDKEWRELFRGCKNWMIEQVQNLAKCPVEEIPDWFIALIREPDAQPDFLQDEIRIVAAELYPKTLA